MLGTGGSRALEMSLQSYDAIVPRPGAAWRLQTPSRRTEQSLKKSCYKRAYMFVCLFVCLFVRSFVLSFVRSFVRLFVSKTNVLSLTVPQHKPPESRRRG